MKCPKCKSNDVVKLSVIHSAGVSDVDARSQGRIVALGGSGLWFGLNTFKTTGTLQSRLSKLANPPHKKPYRMVFLGWFLGLLIIGWLLGYMTTVAHTPETRFDKQFRWFASGYSCLAALALAIFWRYNHRIFPRRYELWNRSFMCRRCGEIFQPSAPEERR